MMAEQGLNAAIIFGAHDRWDFEPMFDQLHDMIAFIVSELKQYDIMLFDHHSAVLTCNTNRNPPNDTGRKDGPSQSLISPPRGSCKVDFHDEWKMRNISDGRLLFLPQYGAQEFCINNPEFRETYSAYVKKLLADTGIQGLMSDDAIFFSADSCSCRWCREKLRSLYGIDMPQPGTVSFWEQWSSPNYRAFINFRRQSVIDFLRETSKILPAGFPLMSCCATSITQNASERGISYEFFIRAGANHLMLEMCGNTPKMDGDYAYSLASLSYHTAMARENHIPCIGLGYGFSKDNAAFIWAFNKFLGSGTWFSTLSHRLGLKDEDMARIPDDPILVDHLFKKEKNLPDWFEDTESVAETAIFFSRNTQHNYGGAFRDFTADYIALYDRLFQAGIMADVVYAIPAPESRYKALIVPSAVCVSEQEENAILAFGQAGKTVILSGPFGFYDETGKRRDTSFADKYHLNVSFPNLERSALPLGESLKNDPPVHCSGPSSLQYAKNCHWFTSRAAEHIPPELIGLLKADQLQFPENWRIRAVSDKRGNLIFHLLSAKLKTELDQELETLRDPASPSFATLKIIQNIKPELENESRIRMPDGFSKAELLEPLTEQTQPRRIVPDEQGFLHLTPAAKSFYILLRFSR